MPISLNEIKSFHRKSLKDKLRISTKFVRSPSNSSASSPSEPTFSPHSEEKAAGEGSVSSYEDQMKYLPTSEKPELQLDDSALIAPCEYIRSLPSKNVRTTVIQACNLWFNLPQHLTTVIIDIITDLHNASLILDDIQDDTVLRRGSPATHCVFGQAQAINSATYMITNNCMRIQSLQLPSTAPMEALVSGMRVLFVGQSWDLKWKFHLQCPSVEEYMAMVDGKTGAMLKMIVHLMHSMSNQRQMDSIIPLFDRLVTLLGRFYQVRDDYQNLQDDTYSETKGFCEDLDEGKVSYPVISCCSADPVARDIILGIFRENANPNAKGLSKSTKVYMLRLIDRSGAFEDTWSMVQKLFKESSETLDSLEEAAGQANPVLRKIISMLISTVQPPRKW